MARRALVIGSQIEGIAGAENDTARMAAMLDGRGFEVDRRIRDDASRAGILAGYDQLIAASQPDDVAVVYYSGHGFHASVAEERGRSWQCIAPTDLRSSRPTDWRGITAWELSIKLAQLTARTRNVAVILDACHAAQMSRAAAVRRAIPRALPHPVRLGFDHHLAWLRDVYGDAYGAVDPLGNPDAVRLVACGQTESAFEYAGADGTYRGAFTEALLDVLGEVGDAEISWAALGDAVRARVRRGFATQQPFVEGPARRRLFSLVEDDDRGSVMIRKVDGQLRLPVGALAGVARGDRYGVMPVGATAYDRGRALGELEVVEVRSVTALAVRTSGDLELPVDAVAIPLTRNAARRPVALEVPAAARDAVARAIADARTLRVAEPGEPTPIATLRLVGGRLTIEDAGGPLFPPARFPDELAGTVKNLANLGVAHGLRELVGEHGVAAGALEVELGVVAHGWPRRLPDRGAAVGLRDRLYVKIANRSAGPLHVHVFGVGVRGTVQLLTWFAPMGVALAAGGPAHVVGQGPHGALDGFALTWPEGLPRTGAPRVDEVVVIATTAAADLRGLETRDFLAATRGVGGPLRGRLPWLQDGADRILRGGGSRDGFLVKQVSWLLHPRDAAIAGLGVEIDDAPGQAAAIEPAWARRRAPPPRRR